MRSLCLAITIMFAPLMSHAVDYVYTDLFSNKKGRITHELVTLSSVTTTVINPNAGFAEVRISSTPALYWYRIDGSTENVREYGFPVGGTESPVIRTINGNSIAIRSSSGTAVQTLRVLTIRPK